MTAFFKVSGCGNDFIALAEPAAEPATADIQAWCRRGISVGADGLFVIRRRHAPDAVDMVYYNADGAAVELCLNGTRCAAQLAFHLGWAADAVTIHNAAGVFGARRVDAASVALDLGIAVSTPARLAPTLDGVPHPGWSVTAGVPHFLLLWPGDLETAPVVATGRRLRHHAQFQPAGTNVNWVRFAGRHRLAIRTYERGVEDETLACGTGVVAAAALGIALGHLDAPVTAATRGGFELTVGRTGDATGFTLAGDARVVVAGDILAGARASLTPRAQPATADPLPRTAAVAAR